MVEEVNSPAAAAPAPVAAAPAASAAAPSAPAASPSPAPVVESAPVAAPIPTLLGAEPPKAPEPAKAAEPAKTEDKPVAEPAKAADGTPLPAEEKKADGSQPAEPAPLPTYEKFTLPEGMTFKDEQLGTFNKMLGDFETVTKADHAEMQKFGQTLIDRHIAEIKSVSDGITQTYQNAWENQTKNWKEAFEKDPEIGGNRKDTSVAAAREFISTHGGTPEQQTAFRTMLQTTGIGNHPEMIRILAKANSALREGKPLAGKVPAPKLTGPQKMYGGGKKA